MSKSKSNRRNGLKKQTRNRVARALNAMRDGSSASRAALENHVSLRTLKQHAGAALVQDRLGGRIRVTKSDHLIRYLQIPGANGPIEISVRGLKAASEAAKYKAAVNRFLRGDRNALKPWEGRRIAGVELLTSPVALKDLAEKDLVPYSLYRSLGVA